MENLSLFGYFVKCYKNYANFKGRARRREYWGFILFYYAVFFILRLPLMPLSDIETSTAIGEGNTFILLLSVLSVIFYLVSLLPLLAVSVRRAHDVGRSGWFILIGLVPLLNLWLLIEFCSDSEPFENDYGKCPKE